MEADAALGILQTVAAADRRRRRRSAACSSSPAASTARCSPPACAGGPATQATTGGTTPSSAPAPSPSAAACRSCRGKPPFGGHILSHDFVEAALLRRGGWAVRMADDLAGSYEDAPPNLIELAARDRRWCQGNLQHARLLGTPGCIR